jgi:hypothetical protein
MSGEPHWSNESAGVEDGGQVKISLAIGKDTLQRLDRIVERGGFGGRGRALDSLLESLEEIVTHVRVFRRNFDSVTDTPEWTPQDQQALRSMVMAAALAFTKMERFYGLNEPPKQQGLGWSPTSQ